MRIQIDRSNLARCHFDFFAILEYIFGFCKTAEIPIPAADSSPIPSHNQHSKTIQSQPKTFSNRCQNGSLSEILGMEKIKPGSLVANRQIQPRIRCFPIMQNSGISKRIPLFLSKFRCFAIPRQLLSDRPSSPKTFLNRVRNRSPIRI